MRRTVVRRGTAGRDAGVMKLPECLISAPSRASQAEFGYYAAVNCLPMTKKLVLLLSLLAVTGLPVVAAARGHGLHTCPQFAFTQFHRIISAELGLPPEQKVLCGMSLGYEDTTAIENSLVSEREPVSAWATFHDD